MDRIDETENENGAQGLAADAPRRRRSRARVVLIVLAAIVAALAIAFFAYVGDYSHADSTAMAACVSDDQVPVAQTGNRIAFGNPDTASVGFVFYPGAKVQAESYAPLMRALASKGCFCVIDAMPFNLALFDIDAAGRTLDAYPQVSRWYVGGHSLGGAMVSQWAAKNAGRIEGIVFLGSYPAADLSGTNLKALSLYGSNDGVLNRTSYDKAASQRPVDWTEMVIEGGNHAGFGDYGVQRGDGVATIPAAEQQEQTAGAIIAWME